MQNLSRSISTQNLTEFSAQEKLWLINLPDELLQALSNQEMKSLLRQDEKDWSEDLKRKVADVVELDNPPPEDEWVKYPTRTYGVG